MKKVNKNEITARPTLDDPVWTKLALSPVTRIMIIMMDPDERNRVHRPSIDTAGGYDDPYQVLDIQASGDQSLFGNCL